MRWVVMESNIILKQRRPSGFSPLYGHHKLLLHTHFLWSICITGLAELCEFIIRCCGLVRHRMTVRCLWQLLLMTQTPIKRIFHSYFPPAQFLFALAKHVRPQIRHCSALLKWGAIAKVVEEVFWFSHSMTSYWTGLSLARRRESN